MAISSVVSSISYSGTTIASVGTATISFTRNAVEATGIGETNATFLAGYQSGTATCDLFFDEASAGHFALFTAMNTAAASAALVLTVASGTTYTGNAFVTGYEITAQAGSTVRATVSFQFTGAITQA
jgi:hypothetical protein